MNGFMVAWAGTVTRQTRANGPKVVLGAETFKAWLRENRRSCLTQERHQPYGPWTDGGWRGEVSECTSVLL
jgi:hypothetical protein